MKTYFSSLHLEQYKSRCFFHVNVDILHGNKTVQNLMRVSIRVSSKRRFKTSSKFEVWTTRSNTQNKNQVLASKHNITVRFVCFGTIWGTGLFFHDYDESNFCAARFTKLTKIHREIPTKTGSISMVVT